MSTYRATVRVTDGMLHLARPLTAGGEVDSIVNELVFAVTHGDGTVRAVDVTIETDGDSGTPLADGITVESHEPVSHAAADDVPDDFDVTPSGRRTDDDDPAGVPTMTAPVPGGVA